MSRRRRKEQSSRPWWFNWPQLRLYLGLDCVWLLRYQRWGGCELLTWCPVSFLEGESFPYLPEEMKENWHWPAVPQSVSN